MLVDVGGRMTYILTLNRCESLHAVAQKMACQVGVNGMRVEIGMLRLLPPIRNRPSNAWFRSDSALDANWSCFVKQWHNKAALLVMFQARRTSRVELESTPFPSISSSSLT
jgi:hypothetical protein